MNKGQLMVISGPSGAGKGTICTEYIKRHPDTFLSVSVTERAPRPGEIDGVHYNFISKEDFDKLIANDGLIEWAVYNGNRYGSPKAPVLKAIEEGRDVIFEIEVVGGAAVRQQYPDGVYIFIAPPSLEGLRERLAGRNTETVQQIENRLAKASAELEIMPHYDYIVVNDTVENGVKAIEEIVASARLRPSQQQEIIEKLQKK
ncbi:MAG: guanylate kinase [Eubacteriales bacterium]|nr:guanylate kinase [Eubacteriales bacterium]